MTETEQQDTLYTDLFTLRRVWQPDASSKEQVYLQNFAEQEFEYHLEHFKYLGAQVSRVKRSMRTLQREDGQEYLVQYDQRVQVRSYDHRVIEQIKAYVKERYGKYA